MTLTPSFSQKRQHSATFVRAILGAIILCMANVVCAKLPPPPAPDPAKVAADAEKAKAQLAAEQAALTSAQDRVADYYRRDLIRQGKTPPPPTSVEATSQANLPKTLIEPPRGTGPQGGTRPSAEAHSGNAK